MGKLFDDGHAIQLNSDNSSERPGKIWYQSHFGVNTSKKIWVVFDCAARYRDVNLNDFLLRGSGMRNSRVGVLTRCRLYLHALISDIKKLYYQCVVKEGDQDFLRFLWFHNNDMSQPAVKCRMTHLSFGLLCTQSATLFCLENTLFENLTGASQNNIIKTLVSFYVDDGLFIFSSEKKLLNFFDEIIPLLNSRGFQLTTNNLNLNFKILDSELLPIKT